MRLSVLRLGGLLLGRIILQQLVDQIDVGHQHTAATIASAAQLGHRFTIENAFCEKFEISLVEIGDDLPEISSHRSWEMRARTLPQEKQRMGMIIVTVIRVRRPPKR